MKKCLFPAASLLLLATPCFGVAIPISNASFESPGANLTSPTGWTAVNGAGFVVGSYNPYQLNGGDAFYLGANPTSDPANGGPGYPGIAGESLAYVFRPLANNGLEQLLSATLAANMVYTLTLREFTRNGTIADPFAGSILTLLAGSTVVGSVTDMTGPAAGSFQMQTLVVDSSSLSSALLGQALTVRFTTARTGNVATDWDSIALDATPSGVPEPATLAVAGAALAVILLRRRG